MARSGAFLLERIRSAGPGAVKTAGSSLPCLYDTFLDMLPRYIDRACRVTHYYRDRTSLNGEAVELSVPHTDGYGDPDCALVLRVTMQIKQAQQFFGIANMGG